MWADNRDLPVISMVFCSRYVEIIIQEMWFMLKCEIKNTKYKTEKYLHFVQLNRCLAMYFLCLASADAWLVLFFIILITLTWPNSTVWWSSCSFNRKPTSETLMMPNTQHHSLKNFTHGAVQDSVYYNFQTHSPCLSHHLTLFWTHEWELLIRLITAIAPNGVNMSWPKTRPC